MIAGVCGGLGEYFNIDATLVRLIFAILAFAGVGMSVILYIVLWIVMPLPPAGEILTSAIAQEPAVASLDAPETTSTFTPDEVKAWDLEAAGVKADSES